MAEPVELPGVDPEEERSIAFRLKDKPDGSLLTHEQDGVFGPVICVTWEEARYYALLELDHRTDPFEISRERLATLSVAFGFTGIHIFRIHEGKTYRRPEPLITRASGTPDGRGRCKGRTPRPVRGLYGGMAGFCGE